MNNTLLFFLTICIVILYSPSGRGVPLLRRVASIYSSPLQEATIALLMTKLSPSRSRD